jgi:hypothetical protein
MATKKKAPAKTAAPVTKPKAFKKQWTKAECATMKKVARDPNRPHVRDIAKHFGCTEGALRQKAFALGFGFGRKKTAKAKPAKAAAKKTTKKAA